MFLPNRLKKCRKSARMSLESLAVDIRIKTGYSVTRQTIENWEKKRYEPSVDGLLALCLYFQKPLKYFFDHKAILTSEGQK